MMQHPWRGAVRILKIKGIHESSLNLAAAAFEHHLNYDLSGYPKIECDIIPALFSKIISIVDRYDAMTSSRVYSKKAKSPDQALRDIFAVAGRELDAGLVKIFASMVGIFPIGSLVMLDTNELGIILESNPSRVHMDKH